MSSVGELSIGVSCDASELTAGMTQVRDELTQTTVAIQRQEASWSALANSAIQAVASIGPSVIGLSSQLVALFATRRAMAVFWDWGGYALRVAQMFPPLRLVAIGLGSVLAAAKLTAAGITSLKDAFQGSVDGTGESILGYNRLHGATGRLRESMATLGTSLVQPFRDGASAIGNYLASFSPLPSLAGMAASAFDGLSSAANYVSSGLKSATATATTAAFILATGASHDAAAAFTEQGQSLEKLSAQTTAFISKQEAARASFQSLKSIQENAADTAKNAAEVAKVASILTVEGIDQSIAALREKSAATIMAGDADKAWEQQTASLFNALEKQRQGIIDGTVVDQAAIDAKKALAKATEDAAKAAADAAEKEQQKTLSGLAKITSLKDQIDLLNGSATNAEVAMREMWRSGFSQEQIDEVGSLTEELDRLKEEEANSKKKDPKEKSGKSGPDSLKAAFQGSSEAASIMLSGVGGGKSVEQIAGKQLSVQEKMLQAVKDNKPAAMMAVDFGAA